MANSAWSDRVAASRHRRAQRTVRSAASRTTSRSLGSPTTWSSTIATSLPKALLDGHGPLRRDGHQPAVDVRAEDGLLFGHFDAMGEAEQLEAAAIGQDRPVPAHEAVQPAQRGDDLFAGPQREMVGVAQDHLRPGGAELFDLQPLDAGLGADGHEGGQLHVAVRRGEDATAAQHNGHRCAKAGNQIPSRQLGAGQSIETNARLRGFDGQLPMNFRGHANHELPAEMTRSKGLGNRFPVGLHVFDDLGDDRSDSAQGRLGRRGQPTQARELGA